MSVIGNSRFWKIAAILFKCDGDVMLDFRLFKLKPLKVETNYSKLYVNDEGSPEDDMNSKRRQQRNGHLGLIRNRAC